MMYGASLWVMGHGRVMPANHLYPLASKVGMKAASLIAGLMFALTAAGSVWAQNISSRSSEPRAKQLLQSVVKSELAAAEHDHSIWTYRDHDKTPDKDAIYHVVESPGGSAKRTLELNGVALSSDAEQAETERITDFVHDTYSQAKQRRAGQHDDEQARQMLLMLPDAFVWTVKSETADFVTLTFRPEPAFRAPTMEARVLGTMGGELVIARSDNRIRTLRGALTDDVKIGYGFLGKLRQGGTFDVERREIAPHVWQIVETHVHIDGRALLFKTIGQQEDEVKSDWQPSTAKSLIDAARQLGAG